MPPKKGKSSASSATRKKQAAKAAKKQQGQDPNAAAAPATPNAKPPQRGQKKDKKSKKEPKKKVFIPPPKPPQPPPDPLDTLGLASLLPPSLVLLLRKAAKKDVITRSRALEGLLHWIDGDGEEQESHDLSPEEREDALVMMLPSWVNLFPRLAASPTRRLRLMTAQILAKLLAPAIATRSELTLSPQYIEPLLGPWSVLVWDTDRATSTTARSAWDQTVAWDTGDSQGTEDKLLLESHLPALASFYSALLIHGDASTTATATHPALSRATSYANGSAPGTPGAEPGRDAKNRDEANVEEDAKGVDARMGAGALGALTWIFSTTSDVSACEDITNLLHAQDLWMALHSSANAAIGVGYPATRSRAWTLLSTLVSRQPAVLLSILDVIAPVVSQAAWEEQDASVQRVMLDAVLPLLVKHNELWSIGGDDEEDEADEEDEEDSDEEEDEEDNAPDVEHGAKGTAKTPLALSRFEKWLQTGCAGNPRQGLPSVLVLLSTIPSTVLPADQQHVSAFLDSFWSSYESGIYSSDPVARAEFFRAFTESSAFLIGKVSKVDGVQTAPIAEQQLGKVWAEDVLVTGEHEASQSTSRAGRATASPNSRSQAAVDEKLSSTLRNLANLTDDAAHAQPLLVSMLNALTPIAQGSAILTPASARRVGAILSAVAAPESSATLQSRVRDTAADLSSQSAGSLSSSSGQGAPDTLSSQVVLLSELLSSFPAQSWNSAVQTFATQALPDLVSQAKLPSNLVGPFVTAFAKAAPEGEAGQLLAALIDSSAAISDTPRKIQVLQSLLDGLSLESLSTESIPSATRLDDVVTDIASSIASGKSFEGQDLLMRLLDRPHPFIDGNSVNEVLAILISRVHDLSWDVATGRSADRAHAEKLSSILAAYMDGPEDRVQKLQHTNLLEGLVFAAFHLVFLVPASLPSARMVWDTLSTDPQTHALATNILRSSVVDTEIEIPIVMEGAGRYVRSGTHANLQVPDILPASSHYEELLTTASAASRPPASATILDSLIAHGSKSPATVGKTDVEGFSPYCRSVCALLIALEENRSTARSYAWAVPHLIMLGLVCEDEIQTPGGSGGLLDKIKFASSTSTQRLSGICQRAVKLCSSVIATLAASLPDLWHATAVEKLQKSPDPASEDALLAALAQVWQLASTSQSGSSHGASRIFARLLAGVLSFTSAGEQDGAKWLRLAGGIETRAPELSEAIIFSAKPFVYGTPVYDRQCSDIVSRLASTPPTKAGTEGLKLLRLASAIAPPAESSLALVPQQRAIFCLQGLQRWIASDEDFDEEVNTRLAELFLHIAPIVQDMPGSHLDFFYDIIESNLEVGDLSDDGALPSLYHTLKLLELLTSLSEGNPVLRDVAKEHHDAILELLAPVFTSLAEEDAKIRIDASQQRIPAAKEATVELLMAIVRQNTKVFSAPEHTATLCKLLGSPMREVQASAFRILSGSIRSAVGELVFESALEKEGEERVKIELTPEVVSVVRQPLNVTAEELEESPAELGGAVMNYLLAWLAIFEHFEEATVQLKSIYAGELQRENLLADSLLPTVFSLLEPQRTRRQTTSSAGGPYNPDRYSIDEVFVDLLDPSVPESLQQVATHIYLRALLYVPAMVREWWVGIKDRQLSMGIANFTIRHCSPLIATRELSHVRDPEQKARLQDEAMSIKVLGSNEVVATYTVDEHPMEIGVRVPHDYPLHGVEVRDIRRVGVSEAQWRAWLLAVQQLIVGQNGLVVDALMLFKRNAEAKFAGFEGAECAICYSIISPTDRSLPTKPCKTCNNKFHASCLYKWVTTSGNSTCPLCRSIL